MNYVPAGIVVSEGGDVGATVLKRSKVAFDAFATFIVTISEARKARQMVKMKPSGSSDEGRGHVNRYIIGCAIPLDGEEPYNSECRGVFRGRLGTKGA